MPEGPKVLCSGCQRAPSVIDPEDLPAWLASYVPARPGAYADEYDLDDIDHEIAYYDTLIAEGWDVAA